MEKKDVKRIVGLVGAIIGIVLGAVSFIGGTVFTIKMFSHDVHKVMSKETICFAVMALSGVIMIIFGATSLKAPRINNGALNYGTAKKITALVSAFVSVVVCFIENGSDGAFYIALEIGYDSFFPIFELLLFIALATLMIISFCMKPATVTSFNIAHIRSGGKKNGTLTEIAPQLRSLKKMKDEGVLTEEQFADAVKKVAENFKEQILKGNNANEVQV